MRSCYQFALTLPGPFGNLLSPRDKKKKDLTVDVPLALFSLALFSLFCPRFLPLPTDAGAASLRDLIRIRCTLYNLIRTTILDVPCQE